MHNNLSGPTEIVYVTEKFRQFGEFITRGSNVWAVDPAVSRWSNYVQCIYVNRCMPLTPPSLFHRDTLHEPLGTISKKLGSGLNRLTRATGLSCSW